MNIPPEHTDDIFDFLRKGHFISEDSRDETMRNWFRIIDDGNNYETLCEYFSMLNLSLEEGKGYYYLSQKEEKSDIERKIKQAYKWIDILDFLKAYGRSSNLLFMQGTIFSASQILLQCNTNHVLKEKLDGLNRYFPSKKAIERIEKLIKHLEKQYFVEISDPYTQKYKVLASFNYLEDLVISINIEEGTKDAISE